MLPPRKDLPQFSRDKQEYVNQEEIVLDALQADAHKAQAINEVYSPEMTLATKQPQQLQQQATTMLEKRNPSMTIYEALEHVGSDGLYQIMFFLFSGFVWLFGATVILAPIFTFEKPGFSCPSGIADDDCESWVCEQSDPSQYYSTHPESFVMAFDPPLICSRQYIMDMSIAINYFGSAIGFIVSLYIADNRGRKIGTIIFWIIAAFGSFFASIFGFNIGLTVFGFALAGFGANSAINIVFCIMNDHSLGKFREYTMAALNPFYGIGGSVLVAMTYISVNFRIMMICMGVPILASCFYLFFIFDPPLFLYEKNKLRTINVLNKIARINKKPFITEDMLEDKKVEIRSSRIYGVKDLFMFKSLRLNAICSGIILFFVQISYYGSNLILSQIGLDTITNALTTSIADTLGYLVIVPIIPYIRRKNWSFCAGLIFSIIFILFNQVKVPEDCNDQCSEKKLQTVMVTVARFFLTFEWGLAFIYITELFPTTVRTIGLGFASFIGYLGSVFCSYFVTYLINKGINPLLGLGVVSIISLVFYFPMSETYNIQQENEIIELVQQEITTKKAAEEAEAEKKETQGKDVKDSQVVEDKSLLTKANLNTEHYITTRIQL